MRKDWKYILYLSIVIGIYVVVKLSEKKKNSWEVTFAHADKEPYGTYAFDQLITQKDSSALKNSYQTIYELKDSLSKRENLFILCTSFWPSKPDTEALLDYVNQGGTVFVSANNFYGDLADTLGLATKDYLFKEGNFFSKEDTVSLYLTNSSFDSTRSYLYKRSDIHNYFSRLDSTTASVIAKNDLFLPVTIRIAIGKGQLILNSTPMVFTNIYLLSSVNNEFVSNTLSFLPASNSYRTEYYHVGRMEVSTPLRFILTTEPLKWAYYITLISILLFMIFEARRKQRIIPVIKPLSNTTIEFIQTIGNLYYQKGDHKNIAEKKIQFFLEQVRTNYSLSTAQRNETFITYLAKKSGNTEEETKSLIQLMNEITAAVQIDKQKLIELSNKLERFSFTHKS
jgi:hypothetical protein